MLDGWGIPYTTRNIRADIETMLAFRREGYSEVPVIVGAGWVLAEYTDAAQLAEVLRAQGYAV